MTNEEDLGTMKFYFAQPKFLSTEISFWVNRKEGQDDDDLRNIAYGMLQDVFPTTWHDWRLVDEVEVFDNE